MAEHRGFVVRPYRGQDLDSLYAICLATGDGGEDAAHLYDDPRLIGHIYAGPYAALAPDLVLVAEDAEGVAGYAVAAPDTQLWEQLLEAEWWPDLRRRYDDPTGSEPAHWTADQRRAAMIHHPDHSPPSSVDAYPAHLHLNLLPRMRGKGAASALLDACLGLLRQAGAEAVHIGANRANLRGIQFWQRSGFAELHLPAMLPTRTIWMGRRLT